MDAFADAADRLAKDQAKLKGRRSGPAAISVKAQRQAEYQRKQRLKLQQERQRQQRLKEYQKQYFHNCERNLHVQSLTKSTQPQLFQATSIFGQGDKITLPPSVLETLTSNDNNNVASPWTFRIGIPNPNYKEFPASVLMQTLKPPTDDEDDDDHQIMMDDDDDSDAEDNDTKTAAYLEELDYQYLSYTHCTVVEFTQDEGHVGIPQHVASALLDPQNRHDHHHTTEIPTTRTVDPSAKMASPTDNNQNDDINDHDNKMEDDDAPAAIASPIVEKEPTQTPGHVAWGAFDLPDMPLEIKLVQLPKGKGCTLVPTPEAVQRGFYALKDVKLVLEQSLIRTRATLSKGDVVSTWHRGVQFDLNVTKVIPSAYGAVTCINTDIEVEIGATSVPVPSSPGQQHTPSTTTNATDKNDTFGGHGQTLGAGRTLGSSTLETTTTTTSPMETTTSSPSQTASSSSLSLPPEPPADQTEHVVNVQIRFSGGNGKRRFDIQQHTVHQLMDFAASLPGMPNTTNNGFQLVTRFPRRVLTRDSQQQTLAQAGIGAGQELFLVESL